MAGSPESATTFERDVGSRSYLELDTRPSLNDGDVDKREVIQRGNSLYVNVADFTRRTTGLAKGDQVLVTPAGEGFLVVPFDG